jgi:hypothetical protein
MKRTGKIALLMSVSAVAVHLAGVAQAQADFEGIWNPQHPPRMGQPPPDEVKLTAEGQVEYAAFSADKDPTLRCLMPGIPLGLVDPYPLEIVQQDHQVLFLYEHFHQVRRIFTDGREAPEHWLPSLGGYSTGQWDGGTLVVRTTHLSPDNYTWTSGFPFSGDEDTYVVERYTRDGDVLTFTGEVHDARYYEEPYVVNGRWNFAPDGEIWEYECIPEFGGVELRQE